MKTRDKILIYSIVLGLLIWVTYALIDVFVFRTGSFGAMLWISLSTMEIVHRVVLIVAIFAFGLYVRNLLVKRKFALGITEKQKSDLDKRMRELNSLYTISNYIVREGNVDVMLKGICDLLCPAMQYHDLVSARVIYGGREYMNDNFSVTDNKVSFDVQVFGSNKGKLELFYRTNNSRNRLQKEEEDFVRVITDRIGKTLERRLAMQEVQVSREQLRALTAHLHSSLEKERISISREIHDELGQVLTALKINLTLLGKHILQKGHNEENDFIITELKDMESIIDITIKKVRKLITNLRPEVLDNLGLLEALEWQSSEFQKSTGIKCKYIANIEDLNLDKDKTIALFRIYQEALTNVARHSKATKVDSSFLRSDKCLLLRISDNGVGINKSKLTVEGSFGILGMKERAIICGGSLDFETNDEGGTTVICRIPYI